MRKLVSRRADHSGSQQFMNPLQIAPHQLLTIKRSTAEQDCIYCIIFQIKLHICHMLGRLVHNVHNALPIILDSPLFYISLYANVIHMVVVKNTVAIHVNNYPCLMQQLLKTLCTLKYKQAVTFLK
jgi:hypothetical protein